MNKYGIKETREAFELVLKIATTVEENRKTEIGWVKGLGIAAEVFPPLIRGLEGAEQIPKELSDLSIDEAQILYEEFNEFFQDENLRAAFKHFVLLGRSINEFHKSQSSDAQLRTATE